MKSRGFRLSLGRLLIAVNVSLVFLAVAWLAVAAARRLERLADEQAVARVQIAGLGAINSIMQVGEGVAVSTRLLGEGAPIARLVREGDPAAMARSVEEFRSTSRLSGCAVLAGTLVISRSGAALPWERLAQETETGSFALLNLPQGGLLFSASAVATGLRDARIVCALVLDQEFERLVSERTGLPVRLLDRETALSRGEDPQAYLRAAALMDEHPVAARLDAAGSYVAIHPLSMTSRRPVGIVETSLERGPIAASLRGFQRNLGGMVLGVTAVTALLSLLLARWLTRPLETLAESSAR
ncbi:MAG TPA: hypothetical protein VFG76_00035, partial [Candidatus Polarisedimenticolia bacterium]|nr:hypothetical protein [Candidatus Polarisedimenticolia bacterium]